jgi:hypothetical protein
VSQQNQFPPPGAQPYEQPGYGYPQPGYQPQKTNTMAILGLVFAFVFSPLGVVFSAIGLKQVKERREGGRGLALAGLILSIVFLLLGVLIAVVTLAAVDSAVQESVQAQDAASVPAPDGSPDLGATVEDPDGVVAACQVIVPAVVTLEADLSTVATPDEYAAVMNSLRTTMETAAAQTTDPQFIAHVQTLSGDFQQAADAVANGGDPSSLEAALTADGTAIDNDCAAAGFVE